LFVRCFDFLSICLMFICENFACERCVSIRTMTLSESATAILSIVLPIVTDVSSVSLLLDDAEEIDLIKKFVYRDNRSQAKNQNYAEINVPAMNDQYFRSCFRLTRRTFTIFCEFLGNSGHVPVYHAGRPEITVEKHALIYLFFCANNTSLPVTASHFRVSESSVHRVIKRCTSALNADIGHFIKWPSNWQHVEAKFSERRPIRGVLGCIDGSHIPLADAPQADFPERYRNRKMFYSVVLQAVCLPDYTFSDVFCGFPGSCHDAKVLKGSDLWLDLEENGIESRFPAGTFLLGDSAYPNLSWLLSPFKNDGFLTPQQNIFNTYHSSIRTHVEQSFGLLKGRFRKLRCLDIVDLGTAIPFVTAVTCLHNLGLREEEDSYSFFENDIVSSDMLDPNYFAPIFDGDITGMDKRNMIMQSLH